MVVLGGGAVCVSEVSLYCICQRIVRSIRVTCRGGREREIFIDNLLVRIHSISEMVWWTGLTPWEFEFPFPGSLVSTFLDAVVDGEAV
jgi:hypothetical protein